MSGNYLLRLWRLSLMVLTNFYCVPAYIMYTFIFRPLQYVRPDWYNAAEGLLYSGLLHFVSFWVWRLGFTVAETGDDIEDCVDSECVVLVNHQSTGDVLTMVQVMTGAIRRRLSQHVCWILDDMFKYTHFGAVCKIHGDIFILQGRNTRDNELAQLENHLRNVYAKRDRTWIVMFPEGGFLRNRKEVSQQYGRKHGFPHLNHCTLPRVGAVHKILDVLSEDNKKHLLPESFHRTAKNISITKNLKYIIDVTIAYPNGIPIGIDDVVFGILTGGKTVVHYRVYPISSVPWDENSLVQWMYARYKEKDDLLEKYYSTGSFLDQPVENGLKEGSCDVLRAERTLSWNASWCWKIHAFYLLSTCILSYCTFRSLHVIICSLYSVVELFTF